MEELGQIFETLLKDHPDAAAVLWIGQRYMYWDSKKGTWSIYQPMGLLDAPVEVYSSPDLRQALDRLQNLPEAR